MVSKTANMASQTAKMASGEHKIAQRWSQDSPKMTAQMVQESPRRLKKGPRGPQDGHIRL
eukprot:6118335-Pyramimonas_sp.AAC.1